MITHREIYLLDANRDWQHTHTQPIDAPWPRGLRSAAAMLDAADNTLANKLFLIKVDLPGVGYKHSSIISNVVRYFIELRDE